jgi:hypothetical protein
MRLLIAMGKFMQKIEKDKTFYKNHISRVGRLRRKKGSKMIFTLSKSNLNREFSLKNIK